ncbi:aminotransferase class I/II-fold pyridoxal phosphate-dependent enzyme [Fusibacter sp. JL216-2]|uniref:aminotransferase class I/II-fold pyridoxal phosphate-dependent enzyme n=1 Tax=Fusibacter sp. JL216-2 TaxID=3071453 RepID=UPI003D332416
MPQTRTPLLDAIKGYHKEGVIPFDVPGHKHGKGVPELRKFLGDTVMQVDVNSMKCLDNLGNPTGVIAESEALLADMYNADKAFFLVNGTSAGVQAMIMSLCSPGDKLILPRNAHKSATNGLIMSGARPIYVQPEFHEAYGIALGVEVESIKKAIFHNPDAKAVFLINPTYYGSASDLKEIVKYAHSKGMAVLVDEAHGAHLHFHRDLPMSAMEAGADMAAVSLHKTGGSLTQSSALLMKGHRVSDKYIRKIINLNQTTSASYLLMASLDVARKNLATRGEQMLESVLGHCRKARNDINQIPGFYAFGRELEDKAGTHAFDETKLVVNVSGLGLTGFRVYDILRDEYGIQMELGDTGNILAIVSLGDCDKSLGALVSALKDISAKHYFEKKVKQVARKPHELELSISPRDAFYAKKEVVDLKAASGRISGESVMAYPPGIPVVTPGELITDEVINYLEFLIAEETMLTDMDDVNLQTIKVIKA